MPREPKPPSTQFHVDCSPETKRRFDAIHGALGLRTKAETFEAIVYAISKRDKIDPQVMHRIELKLDNLLEYMGGVCVKNGMIFPHKKTWRSRLDLEYLDERSQRKHRSREHWGEVLHSTPTGKRLKQFADYASKETLGQVHAGGFLHHMILVNLDGTRTAPSQLSNDERKRRISRAWFEHLAKYPSSSQNPVIQHRLIFSMSEAFHDKLVQAGINPDRVLQSTTQKVMRKFGDKFHPGDGIGYAYGIHHDTDNLHVHVALCPRTANGAYVGCSMAKSNTAGNKNQMSYLMKCFEQENQRWEKILASPDKMQQQLSKRFDSDKLLFSPRLAEGQVTALRNAQTVEAIRLQNFYQSIRTLEAAIIGKRRYLLAKRNENFVRRLFGRRKSRVSRNLDKIARTVDCRSLREMQDLLFRIKRDYRALHKRYSRQYGFSSYANRNTDSPAHRQQNAQ